MARTAVKKKKPVKALKDVIVTKASEGNPITVQVEEPKVKAIAIDEKVKVTVPYARFIFRFVENPGKTLHFTYETKNLGYTDGNEYHAPLEVCEHLDSLKRGRFELIKESPESPAVKKRIGEIPRCYAQILETYDKEID